jgi:hypothetical protein
MEAGWGGGAERASRERRGLTGPPTSMGVVRGQWPVVSQSRASSPDPLASRVSPPGSSPLRGAKAQQHTAAPGWPSCDDDHQSLCQVCAGCPAHPRTLGTQPAGTHTLGWSFWLRAAPLAVAGAPSWRRRQPGWLAWGANPPVTSPAAPSRRPRCGSCRRWSWRPAAHHPG